MAAREAGQDEALPTAQRGQHGVEWRAQALDHLRTAIEMGFAERALLESSDALGELRALPELQELLNALE